MRCFTSKHDRRRLRRGASLRARGKAVHWLARLAALLLLSTCLSAWASGIAISKAELRRGDEGYRPVADFEIALNSAVEQALAYGVPLYFVSEFSLVRPRWYWLNETIASDERTIRLSYNALTRQYRLSYGALFQNFGNLADALRVLSHQGFSQVPAAALKPGVRYIASVRLHLDLTQLAKPLQINALVGSDWILDTDWYRWEARTAASGSIVVPEGRSP